MRVGFQLLIAIVSVIAAAGRAHAQSGSISQIPCDQQQVSIGVVGPGGAAAARAEMEERARRCSATAAMPTAPDFIAEDSKQLLLKIKLAKTQTDSAKKIAKLFTSQEKSLSQKITRELQEQRRNAPAEVAVRPANSRTTFLTPEMQALRDQHALALRAILTADQGASFETNLKALKERDQKGGIR